MANSDDHRDGRSDVARGYVIANRVTAIGMQMALPPAIGWWADGQFNTKPWLLILGAIFGLTVSMFELLRLAKDSDKSKD